MTNSTISPDKTRVIAAANRQPPRRIARGLLALLFWLAVWQLAALIVAKELFLPAPAMVAARALELLPSAAFWRVIGHTLLRIMLGFGLGSLLGLLLAVLTQFSRLADTLISPALKAVLATPVASFIILMVIWFPPGAVPMLIALLVVLPVMWSNIRAGIQALDPQLLEMARAFGLSRWRKFYHIYLPALTPHFLSACTIALGLAWKSGVAAEVISAPKLAVGSELQAGRVYLQTADVFVWTIVVIILSLTLEWLLSGLFRRWGRFKRI